MTCLDWTIYSWQGFNSLGCPLMLKTNYRCVQSLNISVDVAKLCGKSSHTFTHEHSLFGSVTKKTCHYWTIYSWQIFNSLDVFMSSVDAKNKLLHRCFLIRMSLNISVDSIDRQICGKCSTISLSTLTLWPLLKFTCPDWTIYSWQCFNSLVCPLMLRTNYRSVQSLNISVDVAKCVENFHTLIHYTHF